MPRRRSSAGAQQRYATLSWSIAPISPQRRIGSLKSAARTFRFQLPSLQTSVELAFSASSNVTSCTGADPNTGFDPTDESALIRFALPDSTKLQLLLAAADDIVCGTLRRAYRLYDRMGKQTKRQMSAYVTRCVTALLIFRPNRRLTPLQADQRSSRSRGPTPPAGSTRRYHVSCSYGLERFIVLSDPGGHDRLRGSVQLVPQS